MKEHRFISVVTGKYQVTVFCEKCGYVSQNVNDGDVRVSDHDDTKMRNWRLLNIPKECIK